jgi:hypothetical protein
MARDQGVNRSDVMRFLMDRWLTAAGHPGSEGA